MEMIEMRRMTRAGEGRTEMKVKEEEPRWTNDLWLPGH